MRLPFGQAVDASHNIAKLFANTGFVGDVLVDPAPYQAEVVITGRSSNYC